jgi:hypothetical protein
MGEGDLTVTMTMEPSDFSNGHALVNMTILAMTIDHNTIFIMKWSWSKCHGQMVTVKRSKLTDILTISTT